MSQDDLSPTINDLIAALDEQEQTLVETIRSASKRLETVRAARTALLALQTDEPVAFDGKLADAIRVLLKAKQRSLVPIEIRDQAKALGYDFSQHKNQMAAVHGVLKRMVDSGEVLTKEWTKQPGVTRYYWSGWDSHEQKKMPPSLDSVIEASETVPKRASPLEKIISDSIKKRMLAGNK